jgi:hypothetical protein
MTGILVTQVTGDTIRLVAQRAIDREQAQALGELIASAIEWGRQPSIASTHANERHRRAIARWLELAEPRVSDD